jgi:hypothetical protein
MFSTDLTDSIYHASQKQKQNKKKGKDSRFWNLSTEKRRYFSRLNFPVVFALLTNIKLW